MMFSGHMMSRSGNISWPPRSPDFTTADFFYLLPKDNVYRKKTTTIVALKDNIHTIVQSFVVSPKKPWQKLWKMW